MGAKQQNGVSPIYRSRLDERLGQMKSLALSMGGCVEETLSSAKEVVLGERLLDKVLPEVKKREEKINILQLKLSKAGFRAIARQAPVAKDLRMILTALSANTDLERMGDLAFNIVHRSKKIKKIPSLKKNLLLLETMFDSTAKMVSLALSAFVEENVEMSQKVLKMDSAVDECQRKMKDDCKKIMKKDVKLIPVCVDLIIISNHLERIADHATNIAEEIIFLQTGLDIRHGR